MIGSRQTRTFARLLCICALAVSPLAAQIGETPEGTPQEIDVAIVLDVSGTMKGLIDSTRLRLWEIVNDLARVEPPPRLRVALVTFGNQSPATRDNGWVRVETDLTEDLDHLSARLFALRSRGAVENVGHALRVSLQQLGWSRAPGAVKLLFVAGNESADREEPVGFRAMSALARDKGILVNAIFCGQESHPSAASWREMATLADGDFHGIDHNEKVVVIETPFDGELARLGGELNDTYVPATADAVAAKKNQVRQDRNARSLGRAVAASRAQAKASQLYTTDWDFVTSVEAGRLDLTSTKVDALSPELRKMSADERLIYFEDLRIRREQIGQLIAELGDQRRRFIAEEAKRRGLDPSRAFDGALLRSLRNQAEAHGFSFADESSD